MRFLFGVGESGCYPNLAKCYSSWLPRHERLRAEGLKAASGRWGGAVTPAIFVFLERWLGWRGVFQVFAIVGVIWAVVFYRWYRDDPRERSGVNAAELRLLSDGHKASGHRNVPWRAFLRSRSAWLLWANWFCYSYGFYFYLTWLPTYLQQTRRLDRQSSALLAGLPLFTAGLGSILSAFICAWLLEMKRPVARVRRAIAIAGFASAGILLLVFTRLQDPLWTVAALAASSFAAEFAGPVTWTTVMDLGGGYVGSLAGAMNTLGQLGGAVAPAVIGYILQWTGHNWPVVFYVSAGVYGCGILCWTFMDPVTPLDPDRTNR
jgi:MFS family permease